MNLLKSKALFQIIVIILSTFSVYLLNTRTVSAQSSNICCERTQSGEYCQYTSREQCDTRFGTFPGRCNQAAFCKTVCCIDTSSGECYNNVGVSSCASTVNRTYVDGSCNSVQECRQGCCKVGGQCFLNSERGCLSEGRRRGIESVFDAGITSESSCVDQCRQQEEGCCVERGTCSFTSRGQCSVARQTRNDGTLGFYTDVFCSDSSLNCGQCEARAKKGCVPGDDDVYWFDSCGNKESKAEDCDYERGTICKERGNTASCASVHCSDTEDFPKNTHDPQIGSFRKNGEAWCVYEGRVGPSYDLVGSRHYRRMCVNGEELVEPCKELREEICLQGFVDNLEFSFASCTKNEGVSCVTECNDPMNMKKNKQCCERYPSCFWAANNEGVGKCVPVVPPGLNFWEETGGGEGETGSDAKEVCDKGDMICRSYWRKATTGWKCVANCDCEEKEWPVAANKFCRGMGDCGGQYNVAGEITTGGQSTSGARTKQLDRGLIEPFSFFEESGSVLMLNLTAAYKQFVESGLAGSGRGLSGVERFFAGSKSLAYAAALAEAITVATAGLGAIVAAIVFLVVLIIHGILKIFGIGDTKKYTHRFNCEPWVAPTGGRGCEKCDDDSRFECTEYRCRSLGAACKFINEGTRQAACVDTNPNDVNAPVIQPWREALTSGLAVNPTQTGYAISPMVPAYAPVTFGVRLNEHAQCKYDDKHTNSYDEMSNFFAGELYERQKNVTMSLAGNKDYTFYVRCSDARGNKNLNEYTIQLSTAREPDRTPPRVLGTSIENGAFMPYGTNETAVTFYLNEPSSCRWDKTDRDYEMMPENNTMLCNEIGEGTPIYLESYDCDAMLTIRDDTDNKYYVRCADESNNQNQQSYEYRLRGTRPLTIQSAEPSGTITRSEVQLRVVTGNGAEEGKAECSLRGTGIPISIEFLQTGTNTHTQPLNLSYGDYSYDVTCVDAAGNEAETEIEFSVEVTATSQGIGAPRIIYVYARSRETLTVVTDEPSICRYSKTQQAFVFDDGILMTGNNVVEHSLDEYSPVYYVRCKDEENNVAEAITVYR